jgi:TPR repeat protein
MKTRFWDCLADLALRSFRASAQSTDPTTSTRTASLRPEVANGDAQAQTNLGRNYECGLLGFSQDFAEAAEWYRKAAEQGFAKAQYNLGTLYQFGRGVLQDFALAAIWYRKAAEQGDALAQFCIGALYHDGQGVPQNYAQAAAWYRKAAEKANAFAEYRLSSLYDLGLGVTQSYTEAYFWLTLAAAHIPVDMQEKFAMDRNNARKKLSPAEVSNVQDRAEEWFVAHAPQP